MTITTKREFQPGDKVAMISRGGWNGARAMWRSTVTKVDKRGHVSVEGRSSKFRMDGREVCGLSGYGYPYRLELLTPELEEELAEAKRLCHRIGGAIEKAGRAASGDFAVQVAELIPPELIAILDAEK